MITVNMHEAKTHLSKLVERAVQGESFIIARAGKPLVRVVAVEAPEMPKRLGFMEGFATIPEDVKAFGRDEIEQMFYGEEE